VGLADKKNYKDNKPMDKKDERNSPYFETKKH
jgi:hypothetical protein